VYCRTKRNANLGTGRSSQGIEGYERGPLRRRRPALGSRANEEEEEGEEEEEEEEEWMNNKTAGWRND
jgi:hypothetical protein